MYVCIFTPYIITISSLCNEYLDEITFSNKVATYAPSLLNCYFDDFSLK